MDAVLEIGWAHAEDEHYKAALLVPARAMSGLPIFVASFEGLSPHPREEGSGVRLLHRPRGAEVVELARGDLELNPPNDDAGVSKKAERRFVRRATAAFCERLIHHFGLPVITK